MSIFVDENTRLIVQGITGRDGSFHTEQMLEYGTRVVAGVTPGKGGREVHGVPVFDTVDEAVEAAVQTAARFGPATAVTGPVDMVTDGACCVRIHNGHPLMGCISGSGCAASALIAAFQAVDRQPLSASVSALAFFGMAGEAAGKKADGPGSFAVALLDALYAMTPKAVREGMKVEIFRVPG